VTEGFTPLSDLDGPGETRSNVAELARLFPDAVADGTVDLDVLRDLLGRDPASAGTEGFGLRWPGMADARRLSTLPAIMTLLPKPEESVDWEHTRNIVIEGDNLEVLRLMRRAYTNSVDVIYIDPPYNTGSDFVYDDRRVSTQAEHETEAGLRDQGGALQSGAGSDRTNERKVGASRHSKWLSMMYPRLLLAHNLLKETGCVVIAIDDGEHARLKLLLDRVFGSENFIASVVWQGGVDGYASYISVKHDYMLVYAKNKGALDEAGVRWREPNSAAAEALEAAAAMWAEAGGEAAEASARLRQWWLKRQESDPNAAALAHFDQFDSEGRVFYGGDAGAPVWRANRCFKQLVHPVTRKAAPAPKNGWRWDEAELDRRHAAGMIVFGPNEATVPKRKDYLMPNVGQVVKSVFEQDRRGASGRLENLMGQKVFDFPKDEKVLARWLRIVAAPDALVLDFFAGSGTTGQAVMDLNATDGGSRRYLLVQLDEPVESDDYGTIADITRERLRRAGTLIRGRRDVEANLVDTGFRSYQLAESNVRPWDGTGELDLLAAVDNLTEGRTTDDLLVEMMLRLGIDLITPVATREVAGSTLYSLSGTLYAFFGVDVTVETADEVAGGIVAWRDEELVDSDVTVVVRDTGFTNSSAKLNLAAALQQAGIKTLRSI
jgi:adenine-specific DNA-methyltransferase